MRSSALQVAVVGAGGYVGAELLALLGSHPAVSQVRAFSNTWAGKAVGAAHLPLITNPVVFEPVVPEEFAAADVIFFATPPGIAQRYVPDLLEKGKLVLDCSPDFRLRDPTVWAKWYGGEGLCFPELAAQATYGLAELNRAAISKADLIAVPGCYATALLLAVIAPLKFLANRGVALLCATGLSGTSGAGRKSERSGLLLAEAGNNVGAYALDGHRHSAEITQTLTDLLGNAPRLIFVPHLLPIPRGMLVTVNLVDDGGSVTAEEVHAALDGMYADDPFITVLEPGMSPQISMILGTNRAVLGTAAPGQPAVVLCALDNLQKGAAGQAVQCLNIRLELPETAGLMG